jgi:hypothetical protein
MRIRACFPVSKGGQILRTLGLGIFIPHTIKGPIVSKITNILVVQCRLLWRSRQKLGRVTGWSGDCGFDSHSRWKSFSLRNRQERWATGLR